MGRAGEDYSFQKQGLIFFAGAGKEIAFLPSGGWVSSSFARDMDDFGHLERAESFLVNTRGVGGSQRDDEEIDANYLSACYI